MTNISNNMFEKLYSATIGGISGIVSTESDLVHSIPIPDLYVLGINISNTLDALFYGAIGALGGLIIREIWLYVKPNLIKWFNNVIIKIKNKCKRK